MKIRRRGQNTIFSLIVGICVIVIIGSVMFYISRALNPMANAENNVTISKEIEVRTGSDDSYPSLKKISAGDDVTMLSRTDTWYEVETSDNYVGWIPGWSVLGSGQKSPEDENKEKLTSYSVILNPIIREDEQPDYKGNFAKTYNLNIAKELSKKLSDDGIKVYLTRDNDDTYPTKETITKLVSENNGQVLVNLDVTNTTEKDDFGAKIYYGTSESAVVAKAIEKNLSEHYISKVGSAQKQSNYTQLSEKLPEVTVSSANIADKVDVDIINDSISRNQYAESLKEGLESYLYYLISIDNYNAKRKEQLLNLPQKGLNIPMYYTKQDSYKNISYGLDGNKTIESNGDAVVALAMIANYLGVDNASVNDIVSWAGNKYYIRNQGTQPTIVNAFADKYNIKAESIQIDNNLLSTIEQTLKDNKPIMVRMKSGLFGDKVTYKVIRGYDDGKFYINDPDDDDVKLTSYNGYTENDIKNNISQAWMFSK